MSKESDYISKKLYNLEKYLIGKRVISLDETLESTDSLCRSKVCKRCGGGCCQSFPCPFSPNDFVDINDDNYMHRVLNTGLLSISRKFYKESSSDSFLLIRPMSYHDSGYVVSDNISKSTNNNACRLFVKGKGCLLESDYRPTGGLLLLPFPLQECINFYSTSDQIREWGKYQKALKRLEEEYIGKRIGQGDNTPTIEEVKQFQKVLVGYEK